MEMMKIAAIICFSLTGLFGLAAIGQAVRLIDDVNRGTMTVSVAVPQGVGGFLLPVIFLIGGLILWKKAKRPPVLPK